jgi:hypothetical protein
MGPDLTRTKPSFGTITVEPVIAASNPILRLVGKSARGCR